MPESLVAFQPQILHLMRKVDVRLPRKENSNSHRARLVHQIIKIIKWIRTSRLPIKNSRLHLKAATSCHVDLCPREERRTWRLRRENDSRTLRRETNNLRTLRLSH